MGITSLLFFLTLWEVFGGGLVPPPTKVTLYMVKRYDRLLFHTGATLKEMLMGMGIASLAAFPIAWMMLKWKGVRALLEPFFLAIQCVPMFTLAPLFILWCGWSFSAIVIPTALMIVFPLTMSIYRGISSTPYSYLEYFRVHGATEAQEFFRLRLPFAMPQIFAGLRISAAIAGAGAIAGEWAGAQKGLGVYMQMCRRNFDLEGVFAALICLLVLSLSFYGVVVFLEKRFVRSSDDRFVEEN